MESFQGKTQEYRYELVVFLSSLFYEGFALGQTQRVSLTEMYLTLGVAYGEPGLQIFLSVI